MLAAEITRKYASLCESELQEKLSELANCIRLMKGSASSVSKADLKPFLEELAYLKAR